MVPPRQGLHAGDATMADIPFGLVVEAQFVALQRVPQARLDCKPLQRPESDELQCLIYLAQCPHNLSLVRINQFPARICGAILGGDPFDPQNIEGSPPDGQQQQHSQERKQGPRFSQASLRCSTSCMAMRLPPARRPASIARHASRAET
jgi:hypothetical protein